MATRKLKSTHKAFLRKLGNKVKHLILKERGYSSLDAFWLEHGDKIAKPTLYQLCEGKRDMKTSTLLGLCEALGITLSDLISDL